jgi:hypothetical protein
LVLALTGVVAAVVPAAASAKFLGGVTGDGWPVTVEINKSGKQVVRASIGLTLNCTSGGIIPLPDFYKKLKISKKGKFGASFGPETATNPDGTKNVFEGSMSGKANKARTKASGKWQLKITDLSAANVVTDTCDSGSVSWRATD